MQGHTHYERDPVAAPPDPVKRLAAAVIIQAMRAAHHLRNMEAVFFLVNEAEGEGGWCDLADVQPEKLFSFIVAGCPKVPHNHYGEHSGTRQARSTASQDFDTYDNPTTEARRRMAHGSQEVD